MLPNRKILVHKPVEVRNLSKALQERDVATKDFHWQVKYDGCCTIAVVKDGEVSFFTREANVVHSLAHIGFAMQDWPDGVYFGEAWAEGMEFSQISGLFRRQASSVETGALSLVLFDRVSLEEFEAGSSEVPFEVRWINVLEAHAGCKIAAFGKQVIFLARGALGGTDGFRELDEMVKAKQAQGLYETDGYIAKERAGIWQAGAGKGGQTVKVKDHMSVDLRCTGVEEGQGKFAGMVGSLICEYRGKVLKVGGGKLTDAERQMYWEAAKRDSGKGSLFHPHNIVGKIVEVHGLKGSTLDLIREPRFQRIRHDKTEPSE